MPRIRIIAPHGVVGREIGDEYETSEHEASALVAQKSAVIVQSVRPEKPKGVVKK